MGMFDTLYDGEHEAQIKCFYLATYDSTFKDIAYSGGRLLEFNVGDELPIHDESYYDYPDNFYIHVDADSYDDIYIPFAVVRDGKFDGFLFNVDDATEFDVYYSSYGERIRVNNLDEFKQYEQALRDEWNKPGSTRNFITFREHWHTPLTPQQRYAEMLDCRRFAQHIVDSGVEFKYVDYRRQLDELNEMIRQYEEEN